MRRKPNLSPPSRRPPSVLCARDTGPFQSVLRWGGRGLLLTFDRIMKLLLLFFPLFAVAAWATPPSADHGANQDAPVQLAPFIVTAISDSQLSFGFSLRIVRLMPADRVMAMFVERVKEGTDADRKGLKAGSRVLTIDGRPVDEFDATFASGSDLCRIFIGRPELAHVTIEVLPPGTNKTKKFKIVRRTLFVELPKIGGLPTN